MTRVLIYVLIIVAVFVYNLLKDKWKADANREKSKAQNRPVGGIAESMQASVQKKPQRRPSDPFLTAEMNTYDVEKPNKHQNQRAGQKSRANVPNPVDEKRKPEISFKSVEDARRAFIASEIWNRKY